VKVIMTLGLPGSGKTTWAKQYQTDHLNVVRVNKDDLRAMMHNGEYRNYDIAILVVRDFIVREALESGYDVIVDDTNFSPRHRVRLEELAAQYGADFEVQDFTHVPLETCIERDVGRDKPVGEQVIRQMWEQYLKQS
jgi:predicted kinase